jgi:ATP-dependent 26S proteasome regulatory subunit
MSEFEGNQEEEINNNNIEISLSKDLKDQNVIVIPINTTPNNSDDNNVTEKLEENKVSWKSRIKSNLFVKFLITAIVLISGIIGIIYVARMPTKSPRKETQGSDEKDEGEFYTGYDAILDDGKKTKKSDLVSYVERVIEETRIDPNQIDVHWEDVIGQVSAKRALIESIVLPVKYPKIFKGPRAPPRGILLFGPPGTGKTMLAKAVAKSCNVTLFNVSASTFSSHYYGESERLMSALFFAARKVQQTVVIFIDEIDSILGMRGGTSEHETARKVKTEFMIQSDGISSGSDKIIIIGATNRPFDLDPAGLRRFEKKILVELPDEDDRAELLKKSINGISHNLDDQTFRELSQMMRGSRYSSKDIVNVCRFSAIQPIREMKDTGNLEELEEKDIRPVNKEDVIKGILAVRSNTSVEQLHELLVWNHDYGSDFVPLIPEKLPQEPNPQNNPTPNPNN